MMHHRRSGAIKIASQLFSTENAIDAAITHGAELAAVMLSVRQDANLSAVLGQDALEAVLDACSALGKARSRIVEGHKALSVVQGEIGLGPMSFGGFVDKQADTGLPLTAVARLAA